MTENRIDRTLQALKQQGKKALIPFVTAGHGGYDRTEQLVLQMEKAGADIIELAFRFLTRLQKVLLFSTPANRL